MQPTAPARAAGRRAGRRPRIFVRVALRQRRVGRGVSRDAARSAPGPPDAATPRGPPRRRARRHRRLQSGYAFADKSGLVTAVAGWTSDATTAEATYGHISTWETGGVTDMSYLFCVRQDYMDDYSYQDDCVLSTSSFNEDIGTWDTSGVTWMYGMFWYASSFNQMMK